MSLLALEDPPSRSWTRAGWLALVALTVAAATPLSAQEDTTAVIPLPEVVVRATRLPLAAGSLPFALTVRRPALDVPAAGWSLAEALRAVPGLQVQSRHNDALGDRIVMRGFGARAQFGVRGVHVLVDGIPATMPDGQTTLNHLDLGTLSRAEVLRGPAAAAHGNAAGGVLVLRTRAPPALGSRHELSGMAGGHGLFRARVTTAGGTELGSRRVGWVASLSREWRDGFRPHSGTDRYQGTGRVDAPLAGGALTVVAHGVGYDAENPGALTPEQFAADPYQAQGFNVAQATGERGTHGQAGATWTRALGSVRVEGTAYGLTRSLENPIPPSIIALDRRAGGLRAVVRGGPAASDPSAGRAGSGWQWAAGLDVAVQSDDRQNYENVDGDRGELTLDQAERVTNLALHGHALVPILDAVGLYASGRYDRIGFSADDRLVTAGNPDDSGERFMDAVSPTAGLRVRLHPAVHVFGNVSTAFQTPTTTELVNRPDGAGGFNVDLEPQRSVSYEVGARATPLPGLHVEAAAYLASIDDALVPFEVPAAPGRQFFRNAGEAEHQGLELAAELYTGPLDLLLSYSRTDARFESYVTEAGDHGGNRIPGVRPWTAEAVLVGRPVPALALQLEYQATGAMTADDANETTASGYHLFGVRGAITRLELGGVDVAPYAGVNNVLDETYVASVVPNAFGGRFLEPGPGRTFYAGVRLALGR